MKRILLAVVSAFLILGNLQAQTDQTEERIDTLQEITVSATRPVIKREPGKYVVSVDHSPYLKSQSLDQILNATPGVVVNPDGSIVINGVSGATIKYDNRTIQLSGTELLTWLKTLRGKGIKNVELITDRGAEYDAEGGGGVIRINSLPPEQGFELMLNGSGSYGVAWGAGEGVQLKYTTGPVTIYAAANASQGTTRYKLTSTTWRNGHEEKDLAVQLNNTRLRSYSWRAGLDWRISDRHKLGFEYMGIAPHDIVRTNRNITDVFYGSDLRESYIQNNPTDSRPKSLLLNLNYSGSLDDAGSSIEMAADYSRNDQDYTRGQLVDILNPAGQKMGLIEREQLNDQYTEVAAAQADINKILSEYYSLKFGAKYSFVNQHLNQYLDRKVPAPAERESTNIFRYREQIGALYASFSGKWGGFGLTAGLRGEGVWSVGQQFADGAEKFNYDYWRFFPNASLSWRQENGNLWELSYSSSINRVQYEILNPFTLIISEVEIRKGNPRLKPTCWRHLYGGYTVKDNFYVNAGVSVGSPMSRDVTIMEGDKLLQTFTNHGSWTRYTLSTGYTSQVGIWRASWYMGIGGYRATFEDLKRNAFNFSVSSNSYFNLGRGFNASLLLLYMTPEVKLYEKTVTTMVMCRPGVSWTGLGGNLMVNLMVNDLFNVLGDLRMEYRSEAANVDSQVWRAGRTFQLSVTYVLQRGKKAQTMRKNISGADERNRM